MIDISQYTQNIYNMAYTFMHMWLDKSWARYSSILWREGFTAALKMTSIVGCFLNNILNNSAKYPKCSWKLESVLSILQTLALNKAKNSPSTFLPWGMKVLQTSQGNRRYSGRCMCIPKKVSGTLQNFKKKLLLAALQISEEALSRLIQWQQELLPTPNRNFYKHWRMLQRGPK